MTSTSTRRRLPNRRPSHTETLQVDGQTFAATVGFDECGRPRELFLTAGKEGSLLNALLADAWTGSMELRLTGWFHPPVFAAQCLACSSSAERVSMISDRGLPSLGSIILRTHAFVCACASLDRHTSCRLAS